MKYFVWWSLGRYDGYNLTVFDSERGVIEHLNRYVENSAFTFKVVKGSEVKFRPVNLVTSYEIAE